MRALFAFVLGACTRTSAPVAPPPRSEPAPPVRPSRLPLPGPVSSDYGTAHPAFLRTYDRVSSRWMALCQARKDTDGDGKIAIHVGHHGELFGDDMQLYLIVDGGEGTQIDNLVDTSFDDRWVAVIRNGALELVDTKTRGTYELANADVESDNRPGAWHRAARFSPNRLVYVRHRDHNDALVIHDLDTHVEREVPIADRIWRFADADKILELYTIPRGDDWPRLKTTLGAGECLGPPASWSTYGQQGPKPTQRFVDLDAATEVKNATSPAERQYPTPVKQPDITNDTGPARWE